MLTAIFLITMFIILIILMCLPYYDYRYCDSNDKIKKKQSNIEKSMKVYIIENLVVLIKDKK